jgi:hypothetical protein
MPDLYHKRCRTDGYVLLLNVLLSKRQLRKGHVVAESNLAAHSPH